MERRSTRERIEAAEVTEKKSIRDGDRLIDNLIS